MVNDSYFPYIEISAGGRMTDKKKHEIKGQQSIQSFFQNEVHKNWNMLEGKYSNKKGKILFALLLMMTDFSQSLKEGDEINPMSFLRVPIFLFTLDEMLLHGWNVLEQLFLSEVQSYVEIVEYEFLIIGQLRQRAIESRVIGEESLVKKKGMRSHEIPLLSETAFNDWAGNFLLDDEWHKYYYSKSERSEELRAELEHVFQNEFDITPRQLFEFEIALGKTARKQREMGGNLPLPYTPEKLFSEMCRIMRKFGVVEENAAKNFLNQLEYSEDRHWAQSPLVKVRIGRKIRYTPILPSLFIEGMISLAWLEYIKKKPCGSRLQGMINKDWGGLFEEYVREILRTHHKNLVVNPGCLRIRKKRFSDIIECTSNQRPEIDVIAQSESNVYLISCKAMDETIGSKLLMYFFQHDFVAFRKNIELDLKYAGQIEQITRCIRKSPDFLEDRALLGKKIIPLLVTSDVRPLSLESVRQWCLDMRLAYNLPNVRIIQAKNLKDFRFT